MFEFAVWSIPLFPVLAAVVCSAMALTGRRRGAGAIAVVGLGIAALVAGIVLASQVPAGGSQVVQGLTYFHAGSLHVELDVYVDAISATLLTVITGVSFIVAWYSIGYMRGDPGVARYFAIFSGFVAAMTMLVLAHSLLAMYLFWEAVGLCSYLLIGFWYERPAAARAATKAFLVNRVADCGLIIGILLLWRAMAQVAPAAGGAGLLDFSRIFASAETLAREQPVVLGVIGFLLLVGAVGKSAQFPLHVWLPDAMEGPTPVSALIHAATMVTAGVYLLARMVPLLVLTPAVLHTAAWLGAITALGAAWAAFGQQDLKRVLAYSTISQLGYMFLAVGVAATNGLATAAVTAAIFHLATHAFFKALLFLSAGNVMHATGGVIDMRRLGGLRRALPLTHVAFLVGAAALAAIPPLAGFWSKDGILALIWAASRTASSGASYVLLLIVACVVSVMTAAYIFRAAYRTFWGSPVEPDTSRRAASLDHASDDHVPHEAPWGMLAPIAILVVGSVVVGGLLGPTHWLAELIATVSTMPFSTDSVHEVAWLVALSIVLAVGGAAVGWWTTARYRPVRAADEWAARWYSSERYDLSVEGILRRWIVGSIQQLADAMAWLDRTVVGGLTGAIGALPRLAGVRTQRFQNGLLSTYALAAIAGVAALLVWLVLAG